MPNFSSCVDTPRISCAILEIVDEPRMPPDGFEIVALIVIPLMAALISIAGTFAALWIALQSRKDRDEERFEHAVGAMLGSIGSFIGELRVYGKQEDLWVEQDLAGEAVGPAPIPPDDTVAVASVLTARLTALDKEQRRMLEAVGRVLDRYSETESQIRIKALTKVLKIVVAWVSEPSMRRVFGNILQDMEPEAVSEKAI